MKKNILLAHLSDYRDRMPVNGEGRLTRNRNRVTHYVGQTARSVEYPTVRLAKAAMAAGRI